MSPSFSAFSVAGRMDCVSSHRYRASKRLTINRRETMKTYRMCIAAVAMLAGAVSAQAHEYDPGGKIVVSCKEGLTPYMGDIAHAIERSHYWATPTARKEMLTISREACAAGSKTVAFVPPADQRYGDVAKD
jgi:hypothetical protein